MYVILKTMLETKQKRNKAWCLTKTQIKRCYHWLWIKHVTFLVAMKQSPDK